MLNNTMIYTQLTSFTDNEFIASIAHTEEEVCKFVEARFFFSEDFTRNSRFLAKLITA